METNNQQLEEELQGSALMRPSKVPNGKKLFLESYGCQMNFSDSEIVASILIDKGYSTTQNFEEADLILVNTCAIRDNAENRVRQRLQDYKKIKKNNPDALIGVLGCMAERLKAQFLEQEKLVDIVVGPDAYRDLPNLIATAETGQKAINVILSKEETYADIAPLRLDKNGVSAFVSIMRGCDNMCSFCVVPFTRGRERSRDPESIVKECREAFDAGYREVTLLGQNVDSYLWSGGGLKKETLTAEQRANSTNFAQLMEKVALVSPDLRVRFSTSHPKDMTNDVLEVMAKYENICNNIHLPVQSGSSAVLEKMNRGYTREWYLDRIKAIRTIMPDCGISTDVITGFCGETEEQHQETLSLMSEVVYDFAFMFSYSERPKTLAERKYADDVPEETKKRRLSEVVDLQRKHSELQTRKWVGKVTKVLIEGVSKKSNEMLMGRNSQNAVVVFPKGDLKPGMYVNVLIDSSTSSTLIGSVLN
ncbi:MAG: tRNA (N6-isopentenyl adenosine(37)-C2)-methylthiotransferase MiaB [Bacteroidota bacterium]|jgi:tRNA-2-methylthio-N6-dimethylallyladenosine synthase|nr:tRNA (N6-isopentenyl adenosine(37)-C2)-methylthiotransferase MiaB [Bacteroidota bacterium]MCA6443710.1 tRNA (N6-isopentenyl adenosine(37)-C2)-methylthiotransferase MiaB [Bacteroidota bacterium]